MTRTAQTLRRLATGALLALGLGLTAGPAAAQGYGLFAPTPSTSPETTSLWWQTQALLRDTHMRFGVTPERPMGRNYLETLAMIQEIDRMMAPARMGVLATPQLEAQLRQRDTRFLLQEAQRYCADLSRRYAAIGLMDHARSYKQWADYYGALAARQPR